LSPESLESFTVIGWACSGEDWVLMRPDGYVGAMVSASETAALERYLRQVGLAN
jgi:hypothetical protein